MAEIDLVEIFKALSDENRIRIVNLLRMGRLCVCEMEAILQVSQSNASRHLNRLRNAGIISSEKSAQWVFYKISSRFREENNLLYAYLDAVMENKAVYSEDIKRYKFFKAQGITCEVIKQSGFNCNKS